MKIKRSSNSIQNLKKIISAIKVLGGIDIEVVAFGAWEDKDGDPWNTPMEIEIKTVSSLLDNHKIFHIKTGEPAYQSKGEYPDKMHLEVTATLSEHKIK